MRKKDLISKFRQGVTKLAVKALEKRIREGYVRSAMEKECKIHSGGVSRYLHPKEPRLPEFDIAMRILEKYEPEGPCHASIAIR